MKRLIMDLDNTISFKGEDGYQNARPNVEVIQKLKEYKELGYEIVIFSSRNMRTHEGNIGKINVHTLPIILKWLSENGVPFDEVIVGKPWCGFEGFYVDDKAIRPNEFVNLPLAEIEKLIG